MKNRRHTERPSGKPKFKERKPCLLCGRGLMKRHGGTWRGTTKWHCPKCRMTYKYDLGVLREMGHPAIEEWWLEMDWLKIPEGMLAVYGGEG